MKPAPFQYHLPTSLDETVEMLSKFSGDDGRILAGGQSLVPIMAFRLAHPNHLIDINNVVELNKVDIENGALSIGATARHAHFHTPVCKGILGNLLTHVVQHIAHYPIRQRGTFCGSIAHADPASEWCLVATTLEANMLAKSVSGERKVSAADFFETIMTTSLAEDELLCEVQIPLLHDDTRFGFEEFNRRAGDFGIVMALVTYREEGGLIVDPHIGVGGAEDRPRRIVEAENALKGEAPSDKVFRAAAEAAAAAIDPMEDHATNAQYRRDLTSALVRRALERAAS
ncbi:MAG: FAD binding domain-containing protein [Pseudomonadota bacterium]|nr:FAD binding domain-containing protein [Pseudomonadota bacterium]